MFKRFKKAVAYAVAGIMAVGTTSLGSVFAYSTVGLPEMDYTLQNNTAYQVDVQLRNYNRPSDRSMSGDVMEEKAVIMVDENGNATVKLKFKSADIMGISAYATDFKLYKKEHEGDDNNFIENIKFKIGEDNSAVCFFNIPYGSKTGIYPGKVFSNIMNREVSLFINWNTLNVTSNIGGLLDKTKDMARKIDENQYTAETYKGVTDAVEESDGVSGEEALPSKKIEAICKIEEKIKLLKKFTQSPFKPNETVHLDVKNEDVIGRNLLEKDAVVKTDSSGNSTVTLKFKKYTDWSGDTVVRGAKFLNRDGNEISEGKFEFDSATENSTYTFKLPYISPSGRYKIKVTADNDETDKLEDIVFDFSTIRTGADFRDLNRILKESKMLKPEDYLKKAFRELEKEIKAGEKIAENKNSSQEDINAQVTKLEDTIKNLVPISNKGMGNTVNLGFSNMTNPVMFNDNEERSWAGGKIAFGKNGNLWKIIDKDTGKIMIDSALVEHKYNEELEDVHWHNSGIRKYLNGEYLENSFSSGEKNAIKETKVDSMDIATGTTQVAPSSNDKVYLLSFRDYSNEKYGFKSNKSREAAMTMLTRDRGSLTNTYFIAVVFAAGIPFDNGMMVNSEDIGAAPVTNIDKDKVLLTKELGKSFDSGVAEPEKTDENTWVLSLIDDSMNINSENGVIEKGKLSVKYSGNNIKNARLSMMVTRNGDYKTGQLVAYGQIGENIGENGEYTVNLPENFNESTDSIYIFTEIINNGKGSDLASVPKLVKVSKAEKAESDENNKKPIEKISENSIDGKVKNQRDNGKTVAKIAVARKNEKGKTVETGHNISIMSMWAIMILSSTIFLFIYSRKRKEK